MIFIVPSALKTRKYLGLGLPIAGALHSNKLTNVVKIVVLGRFILENLQPSLMI